MSGLTEQDILSKHTQCLKEAKEACAQLFKNADPAYIFPRGHLYGQLRRAITALEGSCRQMSMFRSDARWTKLGFVYAKALRMAQTKFNAGDWLFFGKFGELFAQGLTRMDELATRKTGRSGIILPTDYSFLHLPDHKTPQQRLADRLRNTVH